MTEREDVRLIGWPFAANRSRYVILSTFFSHLQSPKAAVCGPRILQLTGELDKAVSRIVSATKGPPCLHYCSVVRSCPRPCCS